MRNITFSADEDLIDKAREVAASRERSLNDEFREWLASYVKKNGAAKLSFAEVLAGLPQVSLPRKYSRDEMNERR